MRCFGRFALYFNGNPICLTHKAEELLALLACENGGPIEKKVIATMLWPNSSKNQSINNLQKLCKQIQNRKENIPLNCKKKQFY